MKSVLFILCCCLCAAVPAADKTADNAKKVLSGNDSAAKKKAVSSLASGGEDDVRIPLLISAMNDRQVGKQALEALERRTGLKPALRAGANPGYPGYPKTRDASGWNTWWAAKKAEEKEKEEMAKLKEEAEEAKKKAEEALTKDDTKTEGEETDEVKEVIEAAKKEKLSDHEKYGKLDRIIFKNGNLLMCYIISKQIDLDGNLTSLDIVHRNGAGQESIGANMISSYEEDVR